MNKIISFLRRINVVYLYVLIIVLLGVSITMSILFITKEKVVIKKVPIEVSKKKEDKEEKVKTVKVDVKGYVVNPGVYELDSKARVIDAINMAGSLAENADTSLINLSQKLKDEMTIIVYSKKEIADYKKNNKEKNIVYIEVDECPDNMNDACINKGENSTSSKSSKNSADSSSSLISINTATVEQLKTLSGIGEAKANDIVEYRTKNGNFKTIEDIKNVSGIGDALFEKIKDSITV